MVFNIKKLKVFYIMEFKTNDFIFQELRDTLDDTKFELNRADTIFDVHILHKNMYNSILNADLCIVDISTNYSLSPEYGNKNVFYELGLVHALGRPTIIICKSASDIPFNISNLSCIIINDFVFHNNKLDKKNLIKVIKDKILLYTVTLKKWDGDNPFWVSISDELKSFESAISYDYSIVKKAGNITISQNKKSINIKISGDINCGLLHFEGVKFDKVCVGCRIKRWGWSGKVFKYSNYVENSEIEINIPITALMKLYYKVLSNQFRFSLYIKTVNKEIVYFDLCKWQINDNYLRDDSYGAKDLIANI
jgi:hypothetical protein